MKIKFRINLVARISPHLSLREWGETLGESLKRVPPGLPKILGRTL